MKIFSVVLLLLTTFSCTKSSYSWFDGTLEEAYDLAKDKIIFLDFYADW